MNEQDLPAVEQVLTASEVAQLFDVPLRTVRGRLQRMGETEVTRKANGTTWLIDRLAALVMFGLSVSYREDPDGATVLRLDGKE